MSNTFGNSITDGEAGGQFRAELAGGGLTGSLIAVFMPLVVGPLILLGLILYQQARNNLTAQATAQLNALADIKETEFDRWAVDCTASLINLSRSPDIVQDILALRQMPNDAAVRDRLASRLDQFIILSPDFQKLLVAEADTGRVIFVFPSGSENLLNVSFLDDSFFRQGRNTPFLIPPVANPKLDPASPSIVVVAPVYDPKAGVIGVLVGVIRLERFLSFLTADADSLSTSGQVYVIISSGHLLQNGTVAGGGIKPVSDGIERALGDHQDGTAFYANPSGVPVYGVYRWLARYEVALLVEQPQAALYAPLDRLAPTFVIGLGAAILLGVGAVFFFARRIARPLQRLTESATHMAGGDLTAQVQIGRRAPREIGLLGQSFNTLAVQLRQTLEGLQQNLSELKRTEQALRQSEERYRSLVEGVPIGIYRSTPAGQILDSNPAIVEMLGYPDREAFLATNVADLYADHQDRVQENEVLENQGIARSFEARLRRRDGTMLWVRDTARAVRNAEGQVAYYEGSLENITERKRAEIIREVLLEVTQGIITTKELQDFLSLVHRSIAKVMYAENFFIILYNKATGLFEEAYTVDKFDPSGFPPSRLKKSLSAYIFRTGEPLLSTAAVFDELVDRGEVELIGTNSPSWLGVPLKTARETIGVIAVQDYDTPNRFSEHDVEILTSVAGQVGLAIERKRAEEALERQAREMAALYETSLEINAQQDLPTLLYAITERAARLSGVSMGALYLMKPDGEALELTTNYHLPQDYNGVILRLGEGLSGRIAQTGQPMMVEDYHTWEGRSAIYVNAPFHRLLGVPLNVRGKVIGVINVEDEQIGSFGEEQVRLVSLFADQAAIAVENARLLAEASRRAEQMAIINRIGLAITSGLEIDHVLRTLDEQCRQVAEVDAFFVALYDEKTGIVRFPFFRFQKEQLDVSARDIRIQPGLTGYVIQTRQPLYLPDQLDPHSPFSPGQVIRVAGSLTRSFIGVPLVLRDQVIGILSMQSNRPNAYSADDVRLLETIATQAASAIENARLYTELEQRVLDRTAQLQAANQELEAFSYSVSHDLRAPLRAMEGFSATLLSNYRANLDEQGQHYLERIQQASQRMAQLINDLLNLSRITRSELTSRSVDLGRLAREIAAELQTLDPQRQAEFVIAEPLTVRGDAHLLQIALQNLLGNAWKFSGTRQKAVIEVGQMTVADFKLQNENWASRLSQSEISNPQSIIYYVRDNGVGFDMEHASKLFAPFQRLHAMHEFPGTGIGLAIVQRVIARHGGRIWVHAQVDQGATFYFTLGEERR